ncbi:hypothetical protein [Nocardia farcinica]|uniref:hypothetical protein n=1 Tax=Nocardia farcinica TaxID=37329 RepID=UPI00245439B4|nr:hypothetical protein [Nocardia farcinica]
MIAKITALLGGGAVRDTQLRSLFDILGAVSSASVQHWLRSEESLGLLAALARDSDKITHEAIDALPQNGRTHHIRAALVSATMLPPRNEPLAQLQLWVNRTIPTLASHHQPVVRSYAEWHIIRRARQRAARGPFRPGADASNRQRIRCAIAFLHWLDNSDIALTDLGQRHIDTYFDTRPSNPKAVATFLSWMRARRLITGIDIPHPKDALPQKFQDDLVHIEQLRRCLTDVTLPPHVRIIGTLVRLYALPVARIVELTTDRFHRDDTHAYLVIDRHPVILPPSLAALIEDFIGASDPDSDLTERHPARPAYLFPGRPSSRPRNTTSLGRELSKFGLPTRAARNSAMIANILDLEPAVISDLYGLAPQTAHKWAQFAQSSWAAYLAARSDQTRTSL